MQQQPIECQHDHRAKLQIIVQTALLRASACCCSGASGSIEDVATGAAAGVGGDGSSSGWRLMACHNAPEFRDATLQDKITLGELDFVTLEPIDGCINLKPQRRQDALATRRLYVS
jgi:hypothetical protein